MPKFTVFARILVDVGQDISAASMEEALSKAKTMKVTDFITIDGDHNDSTMVIDGVFREHAEVKL